MGVRLRDVADHAGVSFKTVSNVINRHPNVSPATRAKVERSIAELRYRPNVSARSLRHGKSGFLAVALPELTSPYFAELASEVGMAAKREGQAVLIEETFGEASGERMVLDGLPSHIVDGVIFSPLVARPAEIVGRRDTTPMVLLGDQAIPKGIDHVGIDNVGAAVDITRHLIETGRRRIAAIGHQRSSGTGRLRGRGYRSALEQAGLKVNPRLIVGRSAYHRESGAQAMTELLDSGVRFDAVFCFNDLMAIGAMRTLVTRGIRVPDDVAVAGFDDIEEGRFAIPSLTTVSPDMTALAEAAVRLIMRRIAATDAPVEHVAVPYTIPIRESTVGG